MFSGEVDDVDQVARCFRYRPGGWTLNVDGVDDSGAYFFDSGRVYVTLYGNTTGSQMIIADALRFRLIEATIQSWQTY